MMPLPSATDPRFKKTQVTRVDAYYLGRKDGAVELCDLHTFDFVEAATAHPDDWALTEAVESLPQFRPFEMPVGPRAPKVIDKRNIPNFPTEFLSPTPPPMRERIRLYEFRGPSGGHLFPRRS